MALKVKRNRALRRLSLLISINLIHIRLRNAHPNINSFYKRMMVWSLAAEPTELRDGWLHVAKLCQEQHIDASRSIMNKLEEVDQSVRMLGSWIHTPL